jgi:hypothetical protein
MAPTWEEFERTTAFPRPRDWRDRPDGPDHLDLAAADMSRASQHAVTRADLLAALPAQPDRRAYIDVIHIVQLTGTSALCGAPATGGMRPRPIIAGVPSITRLPICGACDTLAEGLT